MARNKFDVDERLETPFDFRHLKRVGVYIGKHKWKMLLALFLSALASVTSLAVPKITQTVMDVAVPQKNVDLLLKMALAFMATPHNPFASRPPHLCGVTLTLRRRRR